MIFIIKFVKVADFFTRRIEQTSSRMLAIGGDRKIRREGASESNYPASKTFEKPRLNVCLALIDHVSQQERQSLENFPS